MHFERLRLCWSGRGMGGFQAGLGSPHPCCWVGAGSPWGVWGESRRGLESTWGGREKGPNHSDGVGGCWSGGALRGFGGGAERLPVGEEEGVQEGSWTRSQQ